MSPEFTSEELNDQNSLGGFERIRPGNNKVLPGDYIHGIIGRVNQTMQEQSKGSENKVSVDGKNK